MAGKSRKRILSRGGIMSSLDSRMTAAQREAAQKDADLADAIAEGVDRAVEYGAGARPGVSFDEEVPEEAVREAKSHDRVSNEGCLIPLKAIPDDDAPDGFWYIYSEPDEARIMAGEYCGWCGQRQKQAWGSQVGALAGVYLPGTPTLQTQGGTCEPYREGAISCGNALKEGIVVLDF